MIPFRGLNRLFGATPSSSLGADVSAFILWEWEPNTNEFKREIEGNARVNVAGGCRRCWLASGILSVLSISVSFAVHNIPWKV